MIDGNKGKSVAGSISVRRASIGGSSYREADRHLCAPNDDQIRDTAINILQFEKLGRPSVSVGIFEGQEGSSARSSRSSAISAISSSKTCRGTIGVRLRPVSLPFIFSS